MTRAIETHTTPFDFESHKVRLIMEGETPWFVGKDVCGALGISNHNQALARLNDDERKGVYISDPLGKNRQNATGINEPGVYRLVFTSRVAAAERFKRWLAHEVLPAIRKTGTYSVEKPIDVRAHTRRTSTHIDKAMSLARSAERLEAVAATLAPRQQVLSATVVNGQTVVFDPHDATFKEGDVAIGFDWDGNVMVSPVSNQDRDPNDSYRPGGVRLVYGQPRIENGIKRRKAFFAIGKVVPPLPAAPTVPELPTHYRGRKTLYRDDILRLIAEGHTNRQIAQQTGACYQTVTHWRRWSEDRAIAA